MSSAVTDAVISVVVNGGIAFLLTKFLFRYPARNFLAAKICFGFLFLAVFPSLIGKMLEGKGIYFHDLEAVFIAVGAALGYWYGWKKRSS